MNPPLTAYQTDQLRRLKAYVARHHRPMPVVWRVGVSESDVPAVWRELRDLGMVTITLTEEASINLVGAQ